MQWFAPRGYLPLGGWWALASAIGWTAYILGGGSPIGRPIASLMSGILQTIGLKAARKGWWIDGSLVAWTVGGLMGFVLVEPIFDTFGFGLG
ncbi:MAG: hypothetical protein JXA13_04660 [Anaerolineales bacterium]|nr:hypothetical protein [Anaerolineales bacterium]